MNILSSSGLFIAITSSTLTLILLIYGRTKLHRIWTLFNFAVLTWGVGCFLAGRATSFSSALLGWRIAICGGLFIAAFFYHTAYIISEIKKRKLLIAIYIQAIFFLLLTITTEYTLTNWQILFGSIYYNKATFSYSVMVACWILVVFLGHRELFRSLKKSKGIKQLQARYIFVAFFVGFLGGGPTLIPAFGIKVYPIGNFGVAVYAIIGTYAILRYRLMNINVAIARGAIFGLVYSLVLGIPFGLAGWGQNFLISTFGSRWFWIPMGSLLLFATLGPFIYMFLQQKALNKILAEEKRAHNLLLQASQGMVQIRNLKKLVGLIVHFITKALKNNNVQVFLIGPDQNQYTLRASRFGFGNIFSLSAESPLVRYLTRIKQPLVFEEFKIFSQSTKDSSHQNFKNIELQMTDLKASVIVPCLVEDSLLGFLTLGDKNSRRMYTQDDLNVLSTLANHAALAIQNAQFFEEVKKTQEQLFQAEKMATLGTMADGLSHQINNRFNALSLIAGDTVDTIKMLDKNILSVELQNTLNNVQNALKRIEENVKMGGEIVKGLLKYSRPGQEGYDLVSFDKVINSAIEMAQYKVKLSEIDIIKDYDENLPDIKINLPQMQEVFFNLIDNAYFAMKQRKEELKEENYKGEITISADLFDNSVKIKFSDNGIGVRKEDFDKLFTPFFTTKASSNKGTGLGLFVIQKIITSNHNGKISVTSVYKQGTTFSIDLPLTT